MLNIELDDKPKHKDVPSKPIKAPKPDTPSIEPSGPVAPSNPFEGIEASPPKPRAQRGSNEARALMALLRFPWGPHLKNDTMEARIEVAEALVSYFKTHDII